jgi:hypothetical protein
MTTETVSQALMDALLANIATVNASAQLAATGYAISEAAAPPSAGDSSPYTWIKLDDRGRLEKTPGITVCFIPQDSTNAPAMAPYIARRDFSVSIVAYIQGEADPQKRILVASGVTEALVALYNSATLRTVALADGAVHQCRVGRDSRQGFAAGETKMGQALHVCILEWTGWTYVDEAAAAVIISEASMKQHTAHGVFSGGDHVATFDCTAHPVNATQTAEDLTAIWMGLTMDDAALSISTDRKTVTATLPIVDGAQQTFTAGDSLRLRYKADS